MTRCSSTILNLALVPLLVACNFVSLPEGFGNRSDETESEVSGQSGESNISMNDNGDGSATGSYIASSNATQIMTAPDGLGSVDMPVGALAIDTNITLAESASLSSAEDLQEAGVDSEAVSSGPALLVEPEADVDPTGNLVISVPVPSGANLVQDADWANLVVIFRVELRTLGVVFTGVIPRKLLTIKDGQVVFEFDKFGAFQAVLLADASKVTEKTENKTTRPIVKKDETSSTAKPPVAVTDSKSTDEDVATTVKILVNDTPADAKAVSISIVDKPASGVAKLNTDGTVLYTPAANWHGVDAFSYTIKNASGSSTAKVKMTVTPVNDSPVAVNDETNVNEDTPLTVNVLDNDSDIDGDGLSVTAVDTPASGVAQIINNTQIQYTPAADVVGTYTFAYTISDGTSSATASLSITIDPINDPPIADGESVTLSEDSLISIDVLEGDTDVDGDTLSISAVATPSNGAASIIGDQIQYTPSADYFGTDSFTYTVSDGNGGTDTGTVSVTVNGVNDAPTFTTSYANVKISTGAAYGSVIDMSATDVEGDSITYGIDAATDCPGVSVSGSGSVLGGASGEGHCTIKISATDGTATTYNQVEVFRIPYSPANISSLKLWLDAEQLALAAGASVDQWYDLSGSGNDAVQATAAMRPTYQQTALNALATVSFDGTDDHMMIPATNIEGVLTNTDTTMFVVARIDTINSYAVAITNDDFSTNSLAIKSDGSNKATILFPGTGDSQGSIVSTVNTAMWRIYAIRTDDSSAKAYILREPQINSGTGPATVSGDPSLIGAKLSGGTPTAFLSGEIAEVLLYDTALDSGEMTQTLLDLHTKYGLQNFDNINHTLFVTSTTHDGNLGGLTGADSICEGQAIGGNLLGGQWKAVLGHDTISASSRVTISNAVYAPESTLLSTAANFWTGTHASQFKYDENGNILSAAANGLAPWTGSTSGGASNSFDCGDWTDNGGSTLGAWGDASRTDGNWIVNNWTACSASRPLYCISQ